MKRTTNYAIGYGSLMSHKSLQEDLNNKKFKKVIVKGYKRIFDINLTSALKSKKTTDILNVEEEKGFQFNGVMFKIDDKEIKNLKKREEGYKFKEVECFDFKTKKRIGKAFLSIDSHYMIDKYHKKPNRKYLILCREAAYHINKKFGQFWDETTFTSTGKKIKDWIKKNQEYETINTK